MSDVNCLLCMRLKSGALECTLLLLSEASSLRFRPLVCCTLPPAMLARELRAFLLVTPERGVATFRLGRATELLAVVEEWAGRALAATEEGAEMLWRWEGVALDGAVFAAIVKAVLVGGA